MNSIFFIVNCAAFIAASSVPLQSGYDGKYKLNNDARNLSEDVRKLLDISKSISVSGFSNTEIQYNFDTRKLDKDVKFSFHKKIRCSHSKCGRQGDGIISALSRALPIYGRCNGPLFGKIVFSGNSSGTFYLISSGTCIYYQGKYYITRPDDLKSLSIN